MQIPNLSSVIRIYDCDKFDEKIRIWLWIDKPSMMVHTELHRKDVGKK